jgi:hypothetical protein
MLKKRIIAAVAGIALLLAVAGSAGISADAFGLSMTAPAHACSSSGHSGGGC